MLRGAFVAGADQPQVRCGVRAADGRAMRVGSSAPTRAGGPANGI
jgi:hypothetical protein